MKEFFLTLGILLIYLSSNAQNYTISGYIKDNANGESLIGANVIEQNSLDGSSSNTYGFYSLTLPATDSISLLYSYVGYQPQIIRLSLKKDTTLHVELTESAMLDEVVISAADAEKIQEVTQMSTVSVPIEQIKALPALLGEVDVLKTLQLLPGVQSGNEGTSGLYVRGGGPDQNLILLDGVPVYNASHLFGFFSVFNADAINNVQLIRGGFPARYGGRLSSVIDISMKEGNMKEFHGEGSIGLIASKLTLEGPIVKDKTSFIISGRRTYIDLLARPLIKAQTGGDEVVGYYFYDVNAKINHRFSDKDRLFLSTYLGDDRFYARYYDEDIQNGVTLEDEDEAGLRWGNITSALRWNHIFTPKLFSNTTLTYSRYRFDISEEYRYEYLSDTSDQVLVDQGLAKYLSGIKDFAAKIDFDYLPSPQHGIRFGVNAIHHTFRPGALNYQYDDESYGESLDTLLGAQETRAIEFAAYVEDDIEISRRLKVNAGVHFSGFSVNNELYTSVQPRIAGRYLLNNQTSLKASYVQMAQFIHLLTNSGIGLPTDLWVPATERVKPQTAQQIALGGAYNWNNSYEISLEGYYKTMDNLISYEEGASFIDVNEDWQDKVTVGEGRSYGAELLVQKKQGRTTGWLGYTLSWTDRQFPELNFGKRFPYKYDRRHDLGLAVVHKWKERIDLSFTWVFGTGNAISLPTAKYSGMPRDNYYMNNIYYYGERNSYRMSAYHRLDASITFHKKTRWGERSWVFGVYNAYNRRNPFYLYIDESGEYGQEGQFKQVSLFPVIPSFSYRFNF
ncbi:TonB-dependent receptor [Catalinimonas sp. 4WD22]|uniref:TonB-dependent receptor n=1 Tax=Catalinimonas locisalis TaxID=3133978 RepID=UPI003101721D